MFIYKRTSTDDIVPHDTDFLENGNYDETHTTNKEFLGGLFKTRQTYKRTIWKAK